MSSNPERNKILSFKFIQNQLECEFCKSGDRERLSKTVRLCSVSFKYCALNFSLIAMKGQTLWNSSEIVFGIPSLIKYEMKLHVFHGLKGSVKYVLCVVCSQYKCQWAMHIT